MFTYLARKLVFKGITAGSHIKLPGLIIYLPATRLYKKALFGVLSEFQQH